MAYTVQREEITSLAAEWEGLLGELSEAAPFVHPAWQRVWLEEFQDGRELLLLGVRDQQGLVGVAPLLRDDGGLSLVGHYSICDYMDFVVAPDRSRDVLAALWDALSGESWAELDLRGLREGSSTLAELPVLCEAAGLTLECETEAVAPRVELPGSWAEYLASLSKKDRHELRRKLRRLGAAGELEQRIYTSPETVAEHLPVLLRFMVESRSDKASFLTERMGRFFHRMVPAMAQEGLIRLYELELDGKPIASVLCFDQRGQLLLYNSGYDPEYSSLAAGLASKALCLQDAIESGHHFVDFLRGREPYKYDLGGQDQVIYRCVVRRD